jgi:arylsulfatase A-like enzyme
MTKKVTRRNFLSTSALVSAGSLLPMQAVAVGEAKIMKPRQDVRPNIVFVIADDLRYDDLSSTGHPYANTPNIDRIAREGVKFNNTRCTTPLCTPSRASHLTGLYAHTHRVVNNDKLGLADLSHKLPTFPRVLFNAGYETAFIGKWHMGADDTPRRGFDHWISFRGLGLYENELINVNDKREQQRGYLTDYLNERAVEFIEKSHSKPFVMCVAHKAVHYPYLPAPRYDNLYKDAPYKIPVIEPGDLQGKPIRHINPPAPDLLRVEGVSPEPLETRYERPTDLASVTRDRARCLASLDDGMGMIFHALERTGQLDNTLIVFTSDHGYLMGEHGVHEEKRWSYEQAVRIPLMMRYPDLISAGSEREQSVLSIDIAATLLDLAGVKPAGPMHGKSLLPVFRSADAPLRQSYLCEYFLEKFVPEVPDWQCVGKGKWKYTHYPSQTGMDELYDLSVDPYENTNLINDLSQREVVSDLKIELTSLLNANQGKLAME